ncbi:hypothetical protein [Halomonas sp. YLB-10]|nr:hypothetical protein [Halomonas sp. YLB-10]
MSTSNSDTIVIYRPYITVKGKRIYAAQRGLKAFRIEIPRDRYRG